MRIFIDPYPHWSCGAALKKLHKDKQTNDNKLETRTTTKRIKHGDHDQDPSACTSPKKFTNSPTPSPQGVIIPSHGVQCLVKKLRIQVVFSFKNHALLQRDAHSCSILCALTTCETTAIEPPTDLFTEVEKKIRRWTISVWFQQFCFFIKMFTLMYQTEQKSKFLNSVFRGLIAKLSSLSLMLNEKIKTRKMVVFWAFERNYLFLNVDSLFMSFSPLLQNNSLKKKCTALLLKLTSALIKIRTDLFLLNQEPMTRSKQLHYTPVTAFT